MSRAKCTPRSCPHLSGQCLQAGQLQVLQRDRHSHDFLHLLNTPSQGEMGYCKFKPLNRNSRRPTHQDVDPFLSMNPENDLTLGNECLVLQLPRSGQGYSAIQTPDVCSMLGSDADSCNFLPLVSQQSHLAACVRCKHYNGPI